jgi:methionyl-tRNA formyltransferase
MNIVLLTQDEPFYLAGNIEYLIKNFTVKHKIVACVLFNVSPFGKKESFIKKAKKTYNVFGTKFFMYYAFNFVLSKIKDSNKVERVLKDNKIPTLKLIKSINHKESLDIISSYKPDILLSIAGNQIFKSQLLNLPTKGTLNLHTALLPKYRGLMPTFWVMKNDEDYTGVSVFFVDEGIDSGPILVQKKVKIDKNWTQRDLIKHTKKLGMDAILEAIEKIDSGNYELLPNNNDESTYYSFPTQDDVKEFYEKGKKFY